MRYLLTCLILIFLVPAFAEAGYREDFEREFLTKPWAGEQIQESACIECHSYKLKPGNVPQFLQMSMHYQNGISCHDCHGGDPKDPSMAMSHDRGFMGAPEYKEVPAFCGKCHIRILESYLDSGHGEALKSDETGPNCVTCHGSHKGGRFIKKASISIINEGLCTQCHSYERAKTMKQALFLVEKKIEEVEKSLKLLSASGGFSEDEEKRLFSTHVEFRALFHSIDADLVKSRTDEFLSRLQVIETKIDDAFGELRFRKNFSAFLTLLFAGMSIIVLVLIKTPEE
jgi:nitrate/TMAO reductase-like tetraheme cytochrome c subunit